MRRYYLLLLLWSSWASTAFSQEMKNYDFPKGSNSTVNIETHFPELVEITNWDGNTIKVEASVNIDNGNHNDAFELNTRTDNGTFYISSNIKNYKSLPRKYIVKIGGQEYTSESEKGIQELIKEKGNAYTWMSEQVLMEITLKIFIPKGMKVNAYAHHGGIEIRNFEGEIRASSKHRFVDMAVAANGKLQVEMATRFGEVYTDLKLDFDSRYQELSKGSDRWNISKGTLNGGTATSIYLESKHGNVYLRKVL